MFSLIKILVQSFTVYSNFLALFLFVCLFFICLLDSIHFSALFLEWYWLFSREPPSLSALYLSLLLYTATGRMFFFCLLKSNYNTLLCSRISSGVILFITISWNQFQFPFHLLRIGKKISKNLNSLWNSQLYTLWPTHLTVCYVDNCGLLWVLTETSKQLLIEKIRK